MRVRKKLTDSNVQSIPNTSGKNNGNKLMSQTRINYEFWKTKLSYPEYKMKKKNSVKHMSS